jgi:hypothetical protein
LVVDWAPNPNEGDKLLFVFDGGVMTDADAATLALDGVEIAQARFHPLDDLVNRMPPRLARRLALAVSAAQDGHTLYAEHGYKHVHGGSSGGAAAAT